MSQLDKDQTNNGTDIREVLNFDDYELKDNLLRGIYSYGFESPSPIQRKAIEPMIQGKDLIAQSQSGTGKTGAFTISTLQIVNEDIAKCQALIIAPTRELALQIHSVITSLSLHIPKLHIALCIGGMNMSESNSKIKRTQIIIGTPGRVIKMIELGIISTSLMKVIVLDEADELLSHSFVPQIKKLIEAVPSTCQICLFSATMPRERIELTECFMRNSLNIFVKREMLTLEGISQFMVSICKEEWKFDTLCDLYDTITISQSIIYVNTKQKAIGLKERLEEKGFTISVMHSGLTPIERTEVMNKFRRGNTRILISTDLLARGIDVQQVSIVLNYDLPMNKDCYLHRIGRSGRYGRKGVAINFVSDKEMRQLREIERYYNTQIKDMPENIQSYL